MHSTMRAQRQNTCLAAFIGDSHALMSDNRCGCDSQRAVASIGQGQGQAWGTPRFVSIDRRAHGGTGPRSTVTTWHGGMGAQPHFATEREDYHRGTRQRLTRAGVLRATERMGGAGRRLACDGPYKIQCSRTHNNNNRQRTADEEHQTGVRSSS